MSVVTKAAFISRSGSPVQDTDHAAIGGALPTLPTSRTPTRRE
jgi:hypothetical protein